MERQHQPPPRHRGWTPRAGRGARLGAGEGADAIWLAERGWTVTAVDVSPTALSRHRQRAEQLGTDLPGRITWIHADLTIWEPPISAFDLVTAQFLHLPADEREQLFERAANAVASGSTLLIVGHHPSDVHAGVGRPDWPELYFTAENLVATLGAGWTVAASDTRARTLTGSDGTPATVHDTVLVARRTA